MFFKQWRAPKRRHAVHLGIEQNVYEHLDLGKLLSKQRRHRCVRHCPGEFIEAELKFVRQFHVVHARSVERRDDGLAQARQKFFGRKRWCGSDLAFQLFLKFIQRLRVALQVTLKFPIIGVIRKQMETRESREWTKKNSRKKNRSR